MHPRSYCQPRDEQPSLPQTTVGTLYNFSHRRQIHLLCNDLSVDILSIIYLVRAVTVSTVSILIRYSVNWGWYKDS
jgi:hypothetical protein